MAVDEHKSREVIRDSTLECHMTSAEFGRFEATCTQLQRNLYGRVSCPEEPLVTPRYLAFDRRDHSLDFDSKFEDSFIGTSSKGRHTALCRLC